MLKFAERKVFVSFLMIFSDNTKFGFIKRCSYKAIGNEWVALDKVEAQEVSVELCWALEASSLFCWACFRAILQRKMSFTKVEVVEDEDSSMPCLRGSLLWRFRSWSSLENCLFIIIKNFLRHYKTQEQRPKRDKVWSKRKLRNSHFHFNPLSLMMSHYDR